MDVHDDEQGRQGNLAVTFPDEEKEAIVVYDGEIQPDTPNSIVHVEGIQRIENDAGTPTADDLDAPPSNIWEFPALGVRVRRTQPPENDWEREDLHRRRHVFIFAPRTLNARYCFPTLEVTLHQEDCHHGFCRDYYVGTKYYQATCPTYIFPMQT